VEFQCEKAKNCFENAQTYEYKFQYASKDIIDLYETFGEVIVNSTFRHPVFKVEMRSGTVLKGVLADDIVRVSFPDERLNEEKSAFEKALIDYIK
jgi:hypothetical protein